MPTLPSVPSPSKLLLTTTPARTAEDAICVLAMSLEISSTSSCALRDEDCSALLLVLWLGSAWAGLRSSEGGDPEVGVWVVDASEKGVDLGSDSSASNQKWRVWWCACLFQTQAGRNKWQQAGITFALMPST